MSSLTLQVYLTFHNKIIRYKRIYFMFEILNFSQRFVYNAILKILLKQLLCIKAYSYVFELNLNISFIFIKSVLVIYYHRPGSETTPSSLLWKIPNSNKTFQKKYFIINGNWLYHWLYPEDGFWTIKIKTPKGKQNS